MNLSSIQSPRIQMDARIAAAASAGSISATDQTALSGALDTIDSALASDRANGTKPAEGMKDRIDGLIDDQVSKGTLTEDQAAELKAFFAQGAPAAAGQSSRTDTSSDQMAIDTLGGVGGPRGPGGPPPPPPPAASDSDDDDSTSVTTDTDSVDKQLEALMAFIEKLRDSIASNSATYGSNSASSDSTGLVVNSVG
jgi:hypothetical protein